ncbi:unnamed protein product [marine sediment metagenome]|uniref:Uncharacterized protein n=1 Tax=marine sediment metagenome TaxID=412755 RepID=X1NI40_9ZZZZ
MESKVGKEIREEYEEYNEYCRRYNGLAYRCLSFEEWRGRKKFRGY